MDDKYCRYFEKNNCLFFFNPGNGPNYWMKLYIGMCVCLHVFVRLSHLLNPNKDPVLYMLLKTDTKSYEKVAH